MRRWMSVLKTSGLLCLAVIVIFSLYFYNSNNDQGQSNAVQELVTRLEADLVKLREQIRKSEQNQSLSFSNDDAIHWNSYLDRKRAETAEAAAMLDFRKPAAILNEENGNRSTWDDSASSSLFSQQRSDQDVVIIYNRVPKTGSTTFANVLYTLCKTTNNCTVVYVRAERNAHIYSLGDQMRFVDNVTRWHEKKPAIYHGHFSYIDFNKFGSNQRPLYINLLREPLDRLISYYYFLRHGDNFRPHLKRRRSGNKETFDECLAKGGYDCDFDHLWMQIPFFCGHAVECWEPGNPWALQMAKHNLVNNYLLVGVTEDMGDFVAVLEAILPRFFRGATDLYNTGQKSHLRKTANKTVPTDETMRVMKKSSIYKMEYEFYLFAKSHFDFIRSRTFRMRDGYLEEVGQQFSYEKIRPVMT